MNDSLHISDAGLTLIKSEETLQLKSYWDVNGYAIGYGHHGPEVTPTYTCSEIQADNDLVQDTQDAQLIVRKYVNVVLTQGQFDALVDFVYNVGAGNFASSHVLVRCNNGQYNQVPDELRRWVHSDGQVDNALVSRREKEIVLWDS